MDGTAQDYVTGSAGSPRGITISDAVGGGTVWGTPGHHTAQVRHGGASRKARA